ncbi:hypothetical protein GGR56DRAFT_144173 [Xylariaceae sp. FL0804]|nr:hypothetical protein GGR56DRAFT_144173 [Xylariaceae sp. FL0804]
MAFAEDHAEEKLLPRSGGSSSTTAHDDEDDLEATGAAWGVTTDQEHSEALSPRRPKTFVLRLRAYLWFIDTFLLLVVAALLLLLLVQDWPKHRGSSVGGSSLNVGGVVSGDDPHFSTKITKWEADFSFAPTNTSEFFSDETLQRWRTLFPAKTGFGPSGESFSTTSMTHQLHCLFIMGRIFAGVSAGSTAGLPADYQRHFVHCIDYLRQGIMCAADLATELHDPDDPDDLGPKDGGWNGLHVCKDYGQVLNYLDAQIEDGARIVLPVDD